MVPGIVQRIPCVFVSDLKVLPQGFSERIPFYLHCQGLEIG